MSVVLAVIIILTTAISPVFIKQIEFKAGEKSAQELSLIQEAARRYYIDNNAWPNTLNALKTAGYINPSWTTSNPWGFSYIISNNVLTFSVSNQVPPQIVNLLLRALPSSSNAGNIVTSSIPPPGSSTVVPARVIVSWPGLLANIPSGWALCDGTKGTPDLRDSFILGAGSKYSVGATGGEATHTLTIAEMPAHTHTHNGIIEAQPIGGGLKSGTSWGNNKGGVTGSIGGGQSFNIMPPYYALAYIMKL